MMPWYYSPSDVCVSVNTFPNYRNDILQHVPFPVPLISASPVHRLLSLLDDRQYFSFLGVNFHPIFFL